MALSYKARKRWSLVILLVGMPAYVVVAVTLMNWLDATYGRQPIVVEVLIYLALGIAWALPFRRVFLGVGKPDPDADPRDDDATG
jgi:cytochrome bd-type quinol oxidase subunit 1